MNKENVPRNRNPVTEIENSNEIKTPHINSINQINNNSNQIKSLIKQNKDLIKELEINKNTTN